MVNIFGVCCSKLRTFMLFVVPLCTVLWGNLHAEFLFKGDHLIANYSDCDSFAIKDTDTLIDVMEVAIKCANCTVLCRDIFYFDPHGITIVYLLSESHASIHTYPEHNSCFVDLFSCGGKNDFKAFHEVLKNYLKPKKIAYEFMERSENIKRRELK